MRELQKVYVNNTNVKEIETYFGLVPNGSK